MICYTSVLLYITLISFVCRDIYTTPAIEDWETLLRYMFLVFEFICFVMIVCGNFLFLSVRMCFPN